MIQPITWTWRSVSQLERWIEKLQRINHALPAMTTMFIQTLQLTISLSLSKSSVIDRINLKPMMNF